MTILFRETTTKIVLWWIIKRQYESIIKQSFFMNEKLIHKIINPNFRGRIFMHPAPVSRKAFLLTHLDSQEMIFDFGNVDNCLKTTIEYAKKNNIDILDSYLQIFDASGKILLNDYAV